MFKPSTLSRFCYIFVIAVMFMDILFITGCASSWVTQAQSIVQIVGAAALNILALIAALSGKTVSATDVSTINNYVSQAQSDLTLIGSLLDQYNTAVGTTATDLLTKIEDAITTAQNNFSSIMTAIHVTDQSTVQKIEAVVGVVLAELQSLAGLIPALKSGDAHALKAALNKAHSLSTKEFADAFNGVMESKTGNPVVDEAASTVKPLSA